VIVSHFREYVPFGVFFAIVTPLQFAWAELVRRDPQARTVLLVGVAGNAVIVGVWLVSRTVGLPVGPESLQAEAVRFTDIVATSAEILIVALGSVLLTDRSAQPLPAFVLAGAWCCAALGLVAALAGGGH